ncbi:hypothetical protein N602_10865 [Mycobacterium avium subsp. hominissuis 10-5606]|nr:hypothetical protein N602_10865 [Mycobacterium avium subsp. hominissuis 10-5606]
MITLQSKGAHFSTGITCSLFDRNRHPPPWWLTWPVAEVAATILPLFAQSPWENGNGQMHSIVGWCKTGQYHPPRGPGREDEFDDPDVRAITEATQILERACLLIRTFGSSGSSAIGLTRLGMQALHTDTVRQHLGLGDTPPRH